MHWHVQQDLFELIEEEPEKPDAKDAVVLNEVDGSVAMQHVYFSYLPEQKPIEDFNFKGFTGTEGCDRRTDRLRQNDADQFADAFLRYGQW